MVVVFATDGKTDLNFVPVSCNPNSRYPGINGGPSCKWPWSLIPENRMSNVWTHEIGHAAFDFTDKYGGAGGGIGYWGIMGMASGSGNGYVGTDPLSPVDPISKRDAGWIDENPLEYNKHQLINLISDGGVYFFKPDTGTYGYAIEGRAPFDKVISDGWCATNSKSKSCQVIKPNPLDPAKGILLYTYFKDTPVIISPKEVYRVDAIFDIRNPNWKVVGNNKVTLVPDIPLESTYTDYVTEIQFHATEENGQLYLDITKSDIKNKKVFNLGIPATQPFLPLGYNITQNIPDIDLKVYNSAGQMVGMNYTSGMYEIGIDGVNTSGNTQGGPKWIAYPDSMDLYAVLDATPLKLWAEETNTTLPENITVPMYMVQYDSNGTRTETKPGDHQLKDL